MKRNRNPCLTRITALSLCALLALSSAATAQTITRGPYLQMPGPDQMLVVWHTASAVSSPEVEYGTTPELGNTAAGSSVPDLMDGFKHTVQLTGLAPGTKYFYTVGSLVAGEDFAFTTSPPHDTVQPIRIWTFGDSGYWPGRLGTEFQDTRQAYYDYAGRGDVNAAADATDVMLYLGDNAYNVGDDATHQEVFFGPAELQAWLQRQPFFSAAGNHEGFSVGFDSIAQTGDYFDMFYFPTANELGVNGVASGSEAYYSFDYGNVHFVVLDSEENIQQLQGNGAAMLTWLEADLAATAADWIIAAWHRPPYSMGIFHDSDVEPEEIATRENLVPILEENGVDLVLCGHSHTYERTPLLDGHHGFSTTLAIDQFVDGGDGDPTGQGSYRKATAGQGAHEGIVYIVAGSAADVRSFVPEEGHPAMVRKLVSLGTPVIEIDGDVLIGKFIDETGGVVDTFQIDKGTTGCPDAPLPGCTPASKGKLVLKDNPDDGKDKVIWKWGKGLIEATSVDPVTGNDLRLCGWDATGKVLDLGPPNATALGYVTDPNAPASWEWRSKTNLFLYGDKESSRDGVQKMKLKTGDKGSVSLKARGAGAGVPALPLVTPVTTQLVNADTGECWGVEFSSAKKNAADKFVATGP